ncbi:unnamed protein product [Closterium sp. NIES-64]|nr:unnamed protein product [Closterium sp. NIES-64]
MSSSPLHIRVHRAAPISTAKRRPRQHQSPSASLQPAPSSAAAHISAHGRKPASRGSLFAAILGAPRMHPTALALAIVGAACVVCILILVGIHLSFSGVFKNGVGESVGGWRRGMGGRARGDVRVGDGEHEGRTKGRWTQRQAYKWVLGWVRGEARRGGGEEWRRGGVEEGRRGGG